MQGVKIEGNAIAFLKEKGTIAFESAGWGTGEITIKCRSNTKCEKESLNKPMISFVVKEDNIKPEEVEAYAEKELLKKIDANEIKVLSVEDKRYNAAKRKFKSWKNDYKSEHNF